MQVSYMILQRVSPVTHSIGNCLKRVIVIVASVIFFQNPMSQQNMLGAISKYLPKESCLKTSLSLCIIVLFVWRVSVIEWTATHPERLPSNVAA